MRGDRHSVERVRRNIAGVIAQIRSGATLTEIRRQYQIGTYPLNRLLAENLTVAEIDHLRHLVRVNAGKKGGFPPGHVPWTKGLHLRLSPATEFKPGCMRGQAARNWRPIGTVTVRRDHRQPRYAGKTPTPPQRKWIKVRDDGLPQRRWTPLAHWIWEKHKGPVPAGMMVAHIDGDTMNDVIDNLMLVDQAANAKRLKVIRPDSEAIRIKHVALSRKINAPIRRALRKLQPAGEVDLR